MGAGRKSDPMTAYKMRVHLANGYRYGATLTSGTSKKGDKIRKYIHWGSLDNNMVFTPNTEFVMLPSSEREKYVFPKEWDITAVVELNRAAQKAAEMKEKINQATEDGKENDTNTNNCTKDQILNPEDIIIKTEETCNIAPCELNKVFDPQSQYNNRLYGNVWLLIKLAEKLKVIDDLLITFDYNQSIVNDVLTLAIFPYLTGWNFDRLSQWQKYTKTPSENWLTPPYITRFTQKITDNHRMQLCKLRIMRQKAGAVAACDSTTRSGWGRCLADIRWGNNKDNEAIKNTLEVVVYSLTSHEPIYYRTFPGNMMDARTVNIILADLTSLGIKDVIIIFDRGYSSDSNMLKLAADSIPFLMCMKIGQGPALECAKKLKYDGDGLPIDMEYYPEKELFCKQMDASEYMLKAEDGSKKPIDGLKVNLYLNIPERMSELFTLKTNIENEENLWKRESAFMNFSTTSKERVKEFNKQFAYHKIVLIKEKKNRKGEVIREQTLEFTRNENAIEKARATAGLFSSVSYKTTGDAKEQSDLYDTRDEQEKYFDHMKDQMGFHTQDCSSEDGKTGRLFTLFVGLILSSNVKNVWKLNPEVKQMFPTTHIMLEEMTPIRYVDYPNQPNHMTGFLEPQIKICDAFDIKVPFDCLSATEQNKRRKLYE